jgi:spermidine synthase
MSSNAEGLEPTGPKARPLTYAGLLVVTLTTLAYEITLTRIFSVTMWFHFAFVAISLALFGLTAGALLVHVKPGWFTPGKVKSQMWRFSLLYAVSMVMALVAQLRLPFRVAMEPAAVLSMIATCLLIAVPFTMSGVVVALALTRFPPQVNRLYAADLVGAGLGCGLLVVGFWFFDGPSLVIFIAGVAALGALLLAIDAGAVDGKMLGGLALLVLVVAALGNESRSVVRVIYGKEGEREPEFLHERWNAFSRVTVQGDPETANLLNMVIDGTAGTGIHRFDGDPASTTRFREAVNHLVYHRFESDDLHSVAIVGSGGGGDVLAALQFGADEVVGIEINNDIVDLVTNTLGEFSGHLDEDPRVTFVVDEARSWLTRTDQRFDAIQISLIDTWAATASGAFALSENTLYTTEAWDTFLDRLDHGGILSVTRFFQLGDIEALETIRSTVLAAQVLHDRGAENPRDHILVYEGRVRSGISLGTVLVSPEPLAADVVDRIDAAADQNGFTPILTPTQADPRFAAVTEPGGPGQALGQFDADVSAPTDDRPFFFQMASLPTMLRGEGFGQDNHIFQGVYTLGFLGLGVLVIAAVFIGGPLVHMGRRTSHKGRVPYYLYFCGIGLGFLLVEISQLMRLTTFLGHPTYSLTVVLFTLLVFSGIGSMLVEKVIDISHPQTLLRPLVGLLGLAVVFGFVTPWIIDSQAGASTPIRMAVSVAILVPLSLLMGMPLATGMRAASTDPALPTAFLWGINGATSVVASVFAMVFALFFGILFTFYMGVAAYVLAAASMLVVVRRMTATPSPDVLAARGNGQQPVVAERQGVTT